MITWMQKHKKYLVITIWVSTIAFVGAGFVGWGAYDFNKSRATSVAKVGDIDITMQKFQSGYSRLYSFYANNLGRDISDEEVQQMGLKEAALNSLIQESLLLNYASELGLSANDDEIIAELVATPSFQTNGAFDVKQYESVLKSLRTTPSAYEAELKDKLILSKLFKAFNLSANEIDTELIAANALLNDEISAKIITAFVIEVSEDELKASWEKSKDLYLTSQKYELLSYFIPASKENVSDEKLKAFYEENRGDYRDGEDKIMSFEDAKPALIADFALKNTKRAALEEYVKIKKGESNATVSTLLISNEDSKNLNIDEIKKAKIGEVLKPMESDGGFMVVKVKNIIKPQPKSYEEAKEQVKASIMANKTKKALEESAKAALKNKAGFNLSAKVSKSDTEILGLSAENSAALINKIFSNNAKDGYIVFKDMAVAYEIKKQNLLDAEKFNTFKIAFSSNAAALKNSQLENGLLSSLAKRYKIEKYYK